MFGEFYYVTKLEGREWMTFLPLHGDFFVLRFIKGSRALKAHTTAYSTQFQEYVMWLHTEQGCVQQSRLS